MTPAQALSAVHAFYTTGETGDEWVTAFIKLYSLSQPHDRRKLRTAFSYLSQAFDKYEANRQDIPSLMRLHGVVITTEVSKKNEDPSCVFTQKENTNGKKSVKNSNGHARV